MPDPTGGKDDIPPWILPYVEVARAQEGALSGRVSVVLAGIVFKEVVQSLPDARLRAAFEEVTAAFVSKAIDDCGSTGRHPWPHPPRHVAMLEAAAQLGRLAAAVQNPGLSKELGAAARTLSERGLTAVDR